MINHRKKLSVPIASTLFLNRSQISQISLSPQEPKLETDRKISCPSIESNSSFQSLRHCFRFQILQFRLHKFLGFSTPRGAPGVGYFSMPDRNKLIAIVWTGKLKTWSCWDASFNKSCIEGTIEPDMLRDRLFSESILTCFLVSFHKYLRNWCYQVFQFYLYY